MEMYAWNAYGTTWNAIWQWFILLYEVHSPFVKSTSKLLLHVAFSFPQCDGLGMRLMHCVKLALINQYCKHQKAWWSSGNDDNVIIFLSFYVSWTILDSLDMRDIVQRCTSVIWNVTKVLILEWWVSLLPAHSTTTATATTTTRRSTLTSAADPGRTQQGKEAKGLLQADSEFCCWMSPPSNQLQRFGCCATVNSTHLPLLVRLYR